MKVNVGLKVGTAVREISPARPMELYGYPHVRRVSTGVHDPLLATVLILRNVASHCVVLVSLDVLMLDPGFARELRHDVAQTVGCPEEGVFIGCTHTHSGPVTCQLFGWRNDEAIPLAAPDYLLYLKAQVLAAAREAVPETPAVIAWTSADATGVGGNRRTRGGLTDPECGILAVRRAVASKDLLGLAVVYGMHPTVLHEDSTRVSADFPYYAKLQIQEHVGIAVPIVYLNAPSGNQSPRHYVNGQTFVEAERLGRMLGARVCGALDSIADASWSGDVPLDGRLTQAVLVRNPVRPLPEAQALLAEYRERYARLQSENAPRAEIRTAECAVFGAEGSLALAAAAASGELDTALEPYRQVDVHVVRIGEAALVGFPGELFTEYALDLKRRSSGKIFAVSLVNGNLQGYIVTPEAAAEGGYEATNAVFAPESGAILVEAALSLAANMTRSAEDIR